MADLAPDDRPRRSREDRWRGLRARLPRLAELDRGSGPAHDGILAEGQLEAEQMKNLKNRPIDADSR